MTEVIELSTEATERDIEMPIKVSYEDEDESFKAEKNGVQKEEVEEHSSEEKCSQSRKRKNPDDEETETCEKKRDCEQPKVKKAKLSEPLLLALSNDENLSDVIFNVRGEKFFGIKAIFAKQSNIFYDLLFKFGSKNPTNAGMSEISLNSVTPIGFKYLKDTFYELNPEITHDNLIDVFCTGFVFKIDEITKKCHDFIKNIEDHESLLKILVNFSEYKELEGDSSKQILNDICFDDKDSNLSQLLRNNGDEILNSELFSKLHVNMAKKIISSDNLNCDEEFIFKACLKVFGDDKSWKRHIRFGLMSVDFIYNVVKKEHILSDEELINLYEFRMGLIDSTVFNDKERNEKEEVAKTTKKGKRGRPLKSKKKKVIDEDFQIDDDNNDDDVQEVKPARRSVRNRKRKKN